MQRRAVAERPGQHGIAAARPGLQGGECAAYRLAQAAADTDAVPVRRRVVACAGHLLTAHRGDPSAGGCTVVGTCMLILLIWRILTASLGVGRVSGHRMIDVIPGGDQRPGQGGVSVPGARLPGTAHVPFCAVGAEIACFLPPA